jgi:Beta-lactamase superfamily domain
VRMMKITFIGHACILVQANGLNILSDPWWTGPCFGVQWWIFPKPKTEILDGRQIDYIYISHGHEDHFHKGTLSRFSRRTIVLVSSTLPELAETIKQMGFPVQLIDPLKVVDLGKEARVRIVPTHGGDTLMVIDDGKEICVNGNDALPAAPLPIRESVIAQLLQWYSRVDYLFCSDGVASHFPNCYRIPGKDSVATAIKRQHLATTTWCLTVARFNGLVKFAFPFASSVTFLEDGLFELNKAVHNTERATNLFGEMFPNSPTRVVDMAPGFSIGEGSIAEAEDVRRSPVRNADIRALYAKDIERMNQYSGPTRAQVEGLCDTLKSNISRRREHLEGFPGDYLLAIELRHSAHHFQITKRGKNIQVEMVDQISSDAEVILTTRANYLEHCLKKLYGHEILRVGSGCRISYANRKLLPRRLHLELFDAIICADNPVGKRYGGLKYEFKQAVKKLLGMKEPDLYDLEEWTIWEQR